MAEPISEQIRQLVKTRLDAINIANGYALAADVEGPTRYGGYTPGQFKIDVSADPVVNPELSHPGNPPATAYDMAIEAKATIRPSEKDTTEVETFRARFGADMVKALHNATSWWTWGGLAFNSTDPDLEPYYSEDEPGVIAKFIIKFRTDANDPYTSRA